jgi:AcrR family transcriptional regulator
LAENMARRSDHTAEELSSLVLNSATRMIAQGGLGALSARQIAAEIGYSAGTIYNHFENLDDLTLRIAAQTLERMLAEGREALSEQEPRRALHQLAAFYLQFTARNSNLWDVVMNRRWPDRTKIPDWYLKLVGQVLGIVESAIGSFFDSHETDLRRRSALTLWASMQGIASVANRSSLIAVPERMALAMADQLIEFYVTGLETREHRPHRMRPRAQGAFTQPN